MNSSKDKFFSISYEIIILKENQLKMTGGAGFSLSAFKSSKDNRNLGKIRPKPSVPDGISREENMEKADLNDIEDSIKFRMDRYASFSKTGYFYTIVAVLTLALVIWTLFF